mmetsp:Transcript_19638/g.39053  ORF Transcript_19638/g.39053 Transcript_19638/m.39053 type:complete len:126 (+) Transcript_19638:177-554(+)
MFGARPPGSGAVPPFLTKATGGRVGRRTFLQAAEGKKARTDVTGDATYEDFQAAFAPMMRPKGKLATVERITNAILGETEHQQNVVAIAVKDAPARKEMQRRGVAVVTGATATMRTPAVLVTRVR